MKTNKHKKKRIIAKYLAFSNLFKQKTFFLILPLLFFFISSKSLFAQDNCDDAIEVEADTLCNMGTYELVGNQYWFKLEVSDTAYFQMVASELDVGLEAMYLYSGSCDNLVQIAMDTVICGGALRILRGLQSNDYYICIVLDDDEGEVEFCIEKNDTANYVDFYHTNVCFGDSTWFKNFSFPYLSGPNDQYIWDFGNGDTSMVRSPGFYMYNSPGAYCVTLIMYDNWGNIDSISDTVYVWEAVNIPVVTKSYFVECDSLYKIFLADPMNVHCYFLWSYDMQNWNDTIWSSPTVINMPYSDTIIYFMQKDSLHGCFSEPIGLYISPCCGEEYLFWDNITITSDTTIYNDTLAINGIITIDDCDVGLDHVMAYMNSHSMIRIIGNGSLTLEKDSFMICPGMDDMWDGIYVVGDSAYLDAKGSYFRDAENTIVIKDCGQYNVYYCFFDYNYKAILIDSCDRNIVDNKHSITRSEFKCSNPIYMLSPYNNTRGYVGVETNEVDSLQIGNVPTQNNDYNNRNSFENLDYGIRNVNSNLFVFNNAFVDIDQSNPNPPHAFTGVGIYSIAGSTKNLVVGKNASSGCFSNTFDNCWEAVYAVFNQNISIKNDTILSGIEYGFYARNCKLKSIDIDSNKIDSVNYGIYSYNNLEADVSIAYNALTGCEYGIYVTNNSRDIGLDINNNGIVGGYYPVSVLNTRDTAKVYDNYIEFDYSSVPGGYTPKGIYGGNSGRIRIEENNVYYTGSSGWKPMGIYTDLCPAAYIECNRLYSQYDGIVCVGNMPNSTLKLNLMYGCNYGMYMNSATIGDQLSDSTQTDNRWVNIGTYRMSGTLNAPTNWWYYNSSDYIPSPYNPSLVALTPISTSILPGSCGGGTTTSMGGGSSLISMLNSTTTYTDNVSENQYYEKVYKYDVYKENTSSLSSASSVSFSEYQNIVQSNIDEFYSLQKEITDGDYQAASSTANGISASNVIEKDLLEVLKIQIAQGKDKRVYYTNTEYQQLINIANKNTLLTGYAVFEACGMLGIHPIIEYHMEVKTRSSQIENRENSAYVYPNPATNSISVTYSFEDDASGIIHIYSIEGKFIASETLEADEIVKQINSSNFDNGMYFYTVYTTDGKFVNTGKFIILR
jgi:hypothetical protein